MIAKHFLIILTWCLIRKLYVIAESHLGGSPIDNFTDNLSNFHKLHFHDTKDSSSSSKSNKSCELFIAESSVPGAGRGVFVGKGCYYDSGEYMDVTTYNLVIMHKHVSKTSLIDYVWKTRDKEYDSLAFGIGSLLNHHNDMHVTQGFIEYQNTIPDLSPVVYHYVTKPIRPGMEIFTSYGATTWFDQRNIAVKLEVELFRNKFDSDELHNVGHCISDVYVDRSLLINAQRGLFTKKAFKSGDIVSISSILSLDKNVVVESKNSSKLINYVFVPDDSDTAYLPIGLAAMINHQREEKSNLKVYWGRWQNKLQYYYSREVYHLRSYKQSIPVDFFYIATKDILPNTELFLNYGNDWETEWNAFVQHQAGESQDEINNEDNTIKPNEFRFFITI
eukprot:gene6126-8445_t